MNITVNIPDNIITEADKNASALHIKRSEYIRKALENMNNQILKNEKYARLLHLSSLVRDESKNINQEFEEIEYDPES
ncbi:MAG: CopG family transcriptional regulator [Candidatus Paracaedibacter sp.]